jgi:hypothetical protein
LVRRDAAPLSELVGGSSVFSWAVRVDEWNSNYVTVGVAFADAMVLPDRYGVCDRAWGVYMENADFVPVPVHKGK